MIDHDPIINFLALLVGLAGGWTCAQMSRAWSRPDKWAPVVGFAWFVAALAGMCLLDLTLGLRDRTPLAPLCVGCVIGVLLGTRRGCK